MSHRGLSGETDGIYLVQYTATPCNTLQHTATHCNTMQHTATQCNTLQHTATHCNSPQHTARDGWHIPRASRDADHNANIPIFKLWDTGTDMTLLACHHYTRMRTLCLSLSPSLALSHTHTLSVSLSRVRAHTGARALSFTCTRAHAHTHTCTYPPTHSPTHSVNHPPTHSPVKPHPATQLNTFTIEHTETPVERVPIDMQTRHSPRVCSKVAQQCAVLQPLLVLAAVTGTEGCSPAPCAVRVIRRTLPCVYGAVACATEEERSARSCDARHAYKKIH